MATRSNIRLTGARGNTLWLYRHWDGYPAVNGAAICRAIKKLRRSAYYQHLPLFAPLANDLLAERYDPTEHRPKPQPVYEVTDHQHGDIEWLYDIRCKGKSSAITVTEFNLRSGDVSHGTMNEKEFRSFVAKELVEMRKRIKAYRAKNRTAA